jgi:hypothetical protein
MGFVGDPEVLCASMVVFGGSHSCFSGAGSCLALPCGANANCTEPVGSGAQRTCQCNTGYAGDPLVSCSGLEILLSFLSELPDIDTCQVMPCGGLILTWFFYDRSGNTTCFDFPAPSIGRECTCAQGYAGDPLVQCTGWVLVDDVLVRLTARHQWVFQRDVWR